MMTGLLALLLVVLGVVLLYAYRSQTPSVQSVSYSDAVQKINAGQVKKVTIVANKATLELYDSTEKQQLTLPDRPETFQKLLDDYNAANPSRRIIIDYQTESATFSVIGSIFLSLLPIVLLGAGFVYLTSRLRPR
jgi:ATP-dependent Zn protease